MASISVAMGNGVLIDSFGARDAGAAGVFGGLSGDSLAAMQTNPAAMGFLSQNEWTVSVRSGWGWGEYSKGGVRYDMDIIGAVPEIGVAWRPRSEDFTIGLSVAPLAASAADWSYPDAPGGIGGVTYGADHPHDAGFLAIRINGGVAWRISDSVSIGASLGAVYSRIDFDAPFIFQTNPALSGAKVDLDLESDGWEAMAEVGAVWKLNDSTRVALRYRPQVDLNLSGKADADFSAQLPVLGLGGAPSYATYRATTRNALPALAGGGMEWQPGDRWKIGFWVDWIGWSDAFDDLEVNLSNGTNGVINGAIGQQVSDRVPVRWKDTWVVGLGSELRLSDCLSLRAGWRYGQSPVRSTYATPLNASLLEHTLAVGLGWGRGEWDVDLSYEYQFGGSAEVFRSGYQAGEYDRSKIDLGAHLLGFGLSRRF